MYGVLAGYKIIFIVYVAGEINLTVQETSRTGCSNKHGNLVTTSILSLLRAALYI